MAKTKKGEGETKKNPYDVEYLPMRVSSLDKMMDTGGVERGSTILISGGCGSGKTMLALQSAYNGAMNDEKVVYFSLNEDPKSVKAHAYNSFGWDLDSLEDENILSIRKVDAYDIARDIEGLVKERSIEEVIGRIKNAHTEMREVTMPFHPDRVVIDSLSDMTVAFSDNRKYRAYLKVLLESLRAYKSVNIVTTEAEQEPNMYSRNGIEEFVVDGVIVLYNIRRDSVRTRAIEVLKLRFSDHMKKMVPFKITKEGIVIYLEEQVF